jgi:hypothetical protein
VLVAGLVITAANTPSGVVIGVAGSLIMTGAVVAVLPSASRARPIEGMSVR